MRCPATTAVARCSIERQRELEAGTATKPELRTRHKPPWLRVCNHPGDIYRLAHVLVTQKPVFMKKSIARGQPLPHGQLVCSSCNITKVSACSTWRGCMMCCKHCRCRKPRTRRVRCPATMAVARCSKTMRVGGRHHLFWVR